MNSVNPFKTADFLLPKDADLQKWAIIACDQYTSDPEYWEKARAFRGDAPSALNLILPEAELGAGDQDERTKAIRRKYSEYFGGDFMKEHTDSYIYIERSLKNGKTRCGILGAVDLEQYEPSRYATAELVNIHTDAFEFEPIYRVVKGVDTANFLEELKAVTETEGEGQKVTFCYAGGEGTAVFTEPTSQVTAGTLQRFIDNYIDDFGGECDYIHGEDELKALAAQEGCIGFLFDGISKDGLFRESWRSAMLETLGIDAAYYKSKYKEPESDFPSDSNQRFAKEMGEIFK